MDKAISRLPQLSYLLFIDRMGLFYDIRDICLQIEPFLRDVRIRDALLSLHFSDVSDDDQDRLIWGPTSLATDDGRESHHLLLLISRLCHSLTLSNFH